MTTFLVTQTTAISLPPAVFKAVKASAPDCRAKYSAALYSGGKLFKLPTKTPGGNPDKSDSC